MTGGVCFQWPLRLGTASFGTASRNPGEDGSARNGRKQHHFASSKQQMDTSKIDMYI